MFFEIKEPIAFEHRKHHEEIGEKDTKANEIQIICFAADIK